MGKPASLTIKKFKKRKGERIRPFFLLTEYTYWKHGTAVAYHAIPHYL